MSEKTGSSRDPQRAELTPGSDAAWNHGCTCPVVDNARGRGVELSAGTFFWINASCPIHGKPSPCEAPQVEREGSREENNS